MALTAEDRKRLSKEDQDRIQAYTTAWEQANAKGDKTAMQRAAAQAKAIRNQSGYSNNSDGTYKTNNTRDDIQATSAYKGTGYLQELNKNANDWQNVDLGGGKTTRYSQSLADSKNATAYIPGVGNVRVTIKDGKTQETSLPAGTVVTPDGGDKSWQINGATANGYTSNLYTGTLPSSRNMSPSSLIGGYNPNGNNANIYENLYNQQQQALQESQRQAEEAQRLAVERGVNTLNAQRAGINQQTNEALRKAYINDMQGNRNLEQVMKAQGLTGGLTESSMLDKRSAYESVLNDTRLAGNNMLNQVDTDISNLRTTGDLNIANLASEYGIRNSDLLGAILDKQMQQLNADRNYNYQLGRDDVMDNRYNTEWQYQVGRDGISDDRYNQQWNYNIGQDQIANDRYNQEMQNKLRQQAYENALKANNSSSNNMNYNKTAYDIAAEAYKNGNRSQEVIDIIQGYTGLPADIMSTSKETEFSNPSYAANPYNDPRVNIMFNRDITLPYPNPKNKEEVSYNAIQMQNRGASIEDIIKYGKMYGVELSE